MRKITGGAVFHDIGRAGALGQLGAFRIEDHRQVGEVRYRHTQRAVDVDLPRGIVDVVVAAHDIADAHVHVVHHHREVVGRIPVRAKDHQVVQLAVGDLDPALDLVVPRDHAVQRVAETDHAVRIVPPAGGLVAVGPVVARLGSGLHRRLAHGIKLGPTLIGVIGVTGGDQLLGHFTVAVQAVGLVHRAFVVVQTQPVHRFQDGVDRRLGAALAVGVLDTQGELAAAVARLQPAVQGGARAADVQVAGGTGSETGAAGHTVGLGAG